MVILTLQVSQSGLIHLRSSLKVVQVLRRSNPLRMSQVYSSVQRPILFTLSLPDSSIGQDVETVRTYD